MASNTDIIDQYLFDELPENEKKQFERLLSASSESLGDKTLREEMDLQKDIIMAIQTRGLKECLQRKEKELREKRIRTKRIWRISTWSTASCLVAAMLVLTIILAPMARIMKEESMQYVTSMQISTTRGMLEENDLQNKLLFVYSYINQNQFDEANELAQQLIKEIQISQQSITSKETQDILDQAQWLHAICEMHKGRVLKAKKLLKQIANSDSYYSERAQEILDKL